LEKMEEEGRYQGSKSLINYTINWF
jgi:hypothetical protein